MKGDRERCLAARHGRLPVQAHRRYEMIAMVESSVESSGQGFGKGFGKGFGQSSAAGTKTWRRHGPWSRPPHRAPASPNGPSWRAIFDPALAIKKCLGKRELFAQVVNFSSTTWTSCCPRSCAAFERGDFDADGQSGPPLERHDCPSRRSAGLKQAALQVELAGNGCPRPAEAESGRRDPGAGMPRLESRIDRYAGRPDIVRRASLPCVPTSPGGGIVRSSPFADHYVEGPLDR